MELPDLEFGVRSANAGGNVYVVGVRGELDLHTAPGLDLELRELVGRGAQWLIVDLSAVTFLDSTSIGVLAAAAKAVGARDGALVLVTDSPGTVRALAVTGLDRLLPLRRTLGEALVEAEHAVRREVA